MVEVNFLKKSFYMSLKSNYLFVISLFSFIIISAQVPNGYYDSAKNLSDENLKFALNQIIDNHREFSYTSSDTDVWDILKEADKDPNNSDNVILIYSGISVNAAQEYNSGNGWTREHIWAKSRGDFGTATGIGTDVHALRPLDNTTNSIRNNRSFNNCNTCEEVTDKWVNITGSKKDANDWSFEPRDEVKGDVARMIFYMAVRYEGLDSFPDLELTEEMLPQSDKEPLHGVLSTLLDWHRNDPVDAWEENRNDIIYNSYQGNRNPFLDFPELAEHLWGTEMGVNWTGEALGIENFNEVSLSIYPNPASNIISIKGVELGSKVEIYDTIGRKVLSSQIDVNNNNNTIHVSELKGIYVVNVISQEKRTTKIIVIK
jgi:endonuclease I